MPACIVCKGNYETGQCCTCTRCGSDNRAWEKWKREEKDLGTGKALLRFMEPHFGAPLIIAVCVFGFGWLGILLPRGGVRPHVLILMIVLTFAGCILAVPLVYGTRFDLREEALLRQVKRGWAKGMRVQTWALLAPIIVLSLVLLLIFPMTQGGMVWEIIKWLALEDTPVPTESAQPPQEMADLKERIGRIFPLICWIGYITLAALAYSSSLLLGLAYAEKLDEQLPQPIFLQDQRLAEVVRKEAEIELGRLDPETLYQSNLTSPNMGVMGYVQQFKEQMEPQHLLLPAGADPSTAKENQIPSQVQLWIQAATWVWDELERTNDGGIEMKVARHEIYKFPQPTKNPGHQPHPRVSYTVRADPWGRIAEIKRDIE